MDYVVFGIGFGATILVLGLLLRDLGPRMRYRNLGGDDAVLPADLLVARVAWNRFCNALGTVLAIAGTLFVLATFVCILFMVSDDTGGWVMLAGLALFFLLMLYWTWAFFDRFGSYGILPERPVEAPPSSSADSEPAPSVQRPIEKEDHRVVVGPAPSELRESEPAADKDDLHKAEPMLTQEERLAAAEDPIDHESASGDLDSPAVGQHRLVPNSAERPDLDEDDVRDTVEEDAPAQDDALDPQIQVEGESVEVADGESNVDDSAAYESDDSRRDSGES